LLTPAPSLEHRAGIALTITRLLLLIGLTAFVGFAAWQRDWVGTTTDMLGAFAFGFAAAVLIGARSIAQLRPA
jgi:hypothetical protein